MGLDLKCFIILAFVMTQMLTGYISKICTFPLNEINSVLYLDYATSWG
jgi:hypothetical protein